MSPSDRIYAWPEGELYIYTGGVPADDLYLVRDLSVNLSEEYDNLPMIDGSYRDLLVGVRATVSFSTDYQNNTLAAMQRRRVPVHIRIRHQEGEETPQTIDLRNGRLDGVMMNGREGEVMGMRYSYHCNEWSIND